MHYKANQLKRDGKGQRIADRIEKNLELGPRTCKHSVEVQISGELICYF